MTTDGRAGPAVGDVVLAKWGDRGRMPLATWGMRVSWEINAAGELSALAALADVRTVTDDPEDLRGWWLTWEHPTLASWGGVITDIAVGPDRTVEIAARGWLELLAKRLTRKRATMIVANPGAIAGRLVRDVGAAAPTGIADTDCDEWGDFVPWQDDGGEILDALRTLSDASGQDYGVDEENRIFRWRRQWGSDKTASVQLVQGYHVAAWRPSWSLEPIVTEVVLSPDNPSRFLTAPDIAGVDAAAYAVFGPRQQRGTYHGRQPRAAAAAIASAQAAKLAGMGRLIELDVVDADGCWSWFRRGDTITVVIADLDRALQVRCRALSWDHEGDRLTVSGEVVG